MIPQSILSKLFSKFSIRLFRWISQTNFCSWSLWQILYNMDGKRHKQRQTPKNQRDDKNMGGDQSPSWRQNKAQLDHMDCKGWWTLNTKMVWNIYKVLLHASKMIKQKFQKLQHFAWSEMAWENQEIIFKNINLKNLQQKVLIFM